MESPLDLPATEDSRAEEIVRLQGEIDAAHSALSSMGISRFGMGVYVAGALTLGSLIGIPESEGEFWLFGLLVFGSALLLLILMLTYRQSRSDRRALAAQLEELLRVGRSLGGAEEEETPVTLK